MTDEKHVPNFCAPMTGTWPDPKKIKCRDCGLRDRTIAKLPDGKINPAGVTKGHCYAYPDGRGKPNEILFQNADCKFYISDQDLSEDFFDTSTQYYACRGCEYSHGKSSWADHPDKPHCMVYRRECGMRKPSKLKRKDSSCEFFEPEQ